MEARGPFEADHHPLEVKEDRSLNLPFTIDSISCTRGSTKAALIRQRCSRVRVGGGIHRSDVSPVEQVERLKKRFKMILLSHRKATRETRVHIFDCRLPHAVTSKKLNIVRAS